MNRALLIVLFAAVTGQAQTPAQGLQNVKSLTCEFQLMATGTWTPDGETRAEIRPRRLTLGFANIDTQDGSAEVASTVGAPHIVVQFSGGYLHFMQIGGSGFLYTTTVFSKVSRPGKFKAVHTRHEYTEASIPGYTSRPEQYYGECEMHG